jgi:hypothetical protein
MATAADQQKAIADQAAREAVREAFILLGVDTEDPKSIDDFQADLRFNRSLRRRADQGVDAFFKLLFLAIAGAILTALGKYLGIGVHRA